MLPALILCLLLGPASAPPEAEYERLFKDDPVACLRLAQPLAAQGDAEALFWVGKAYQLGKGTPKAHGQAWQAYQAAADKGHAKAMHNLGSLLLEDGAARQEARPYFEKALAMGLTLPTLYNLARTYDSDSIFNPETPEDMEQASKLYLKAFEAGFGPKALDAAARTAFLAAAARNLKPGSARAVQLHEEALRIDRMGAAQGRPTCMAQLGLLLEHQAPEEARSWFQKASDLGQREAQFRLGTFLKEGRGGPKDPEGALTLFEKAMLSGHGAAMSEVLWTWEHRIRTAKSPEELDRTMAHLEGLDSKIPEKTKELIENSLKDQVALARDRQNLLRLLRFNAEHPVAKAGALSFGFQLSLPSSAGTSWTCTAASPELDSARPIQPSEVLASGNLDASGVPQLSADGAQRLKQALVLGQSLIFQGPAQRHLLKAEPGPGGLVLKLDVRVVD